MEDYKINDQYFAMMSLRRRTLPSVSSPTPRTEPVGDCDRSEPFSDLTSIDRTRGGGISPGPMPVGLPGGWRDEEDIVDRGHRWIVGLNGTEAPAPGEIHGVWS